MVVGEAGIGKTRLLQEFATYARLRGAQVLWGAAYEGEARLPYGPFADALRDYVSRTSVETLRLAVTEGSLVGWQLLDTVLARPACAQWA